MTPLVLRLVHTKNPPVIGMWVYWDDHRDLKAVDAALHAWSMKQWLALSEQEQG